MQINFLFCSKNILFMISKQKIKFITSLRHNKYRLKYNSFIAEGHHVVNDFINSHFEVTSVFATKSWINSNCKSTLFNKSQIIQIVTNQEMAQISCLKSPSNVLAVISRLKSNFDYSSISHTLIALDGISDPGNLGTIIRTADWFGVKQIFLSQDCVDVFNPKVVQATMGSLSRVHICKLFLKDFLLNLKELKYISYGACLSGTSIYSVKTETKSVFVFGSESHGISSEVSQILDHKILIPGKNQDVDSLNVSVAFGIILSEFV